MYRIFVVMKCAVDIFSELGLRLANFGNDEASVDIIGRACESNSWFRPDDIRQAVAILCDDMLRRNMLEMWLQNYILPVAVARRVLVVMAGNIPLVGFLDLLCVVAAGHHCIVKSSSKDAVLIDYVVALLRDIHPRIAISYYDGVETPDAVIATGGDSANRHFRAMFGALPSLLRGSRQSVAVLSGRETPAQLEGLAEDIFAYSGLGCRSVSLIFAPRGYEVRVAHSAQHPKLDGNYRQTRALLCMEGVPFIDIGGVVLVEKCGFPTTLSSIHYAYYDNLSEVTAWLVAHDEWLQCVVTEAVDHPRRVAFGRAQHPSLMEYPDDCDVMAFLLKI